MLPRMENALGRVPVLMSSLALLLSSYSLLLGLNARPSSTIPRATAEPFSAVNEVRIEGLKIHAGQLASGAVHTAHIADASVTGSKLADGAVGMGKLSGEILSSIARGGNVLLGEIDEAGRRIKGRPEGFQATKLGKGDYNLTFAKDVFQDPPVVIAVAQSYGTCFVPRETSSPRHVRIKCLSDLLGSVPQPTDTRFSFFAAPVLSGAVERPLS
jgi:hypothetical protein